MGVDDLVCAACGGRVGNARCPSCRAALERWRSQRPVLPATAVLLLALLLLLLALAQSR
mgnify:CR=1 FL=1|jgi:uncharacterized paraquat-inducible protein A